MKKIDLTIRNFLPNKFQEICVLSQDYFAFLIFWFQLHIVYSWPTILLQFWTCYVSAENRIHIIFREFNNSVVKNSAVKWSALDFTFKSRVNFLKCNCWSQPSRRLIATSQRFRCSSVFRSTLFWKGFWNSHCAGWSRRLCCYWSFRSSLFLKGLRTSSLLKWVDLQLSWFERHYQYYIY